MEPAAPAGAPSAILPRRVAARHRGPARSGTVRESGAGLPRPRLGRGRTRAAGSGARAWPRGAKGEGRRGAGGVRLAALGAGGGPPFPASSSGALGEELAPFRALQGAFPCPRTGC